MICSYYFLPVFFFGDLLQILQLFNIYSLPQRIIAATYLCTLLPSFAKHSCLLTAPWQDFQALLNEFRFDIGDVKEFEHRLQEEYQALEVIYGWSEKLT